jgi:hypothetical protein
MHQGNNPERKHQASKHRLPGSPNYPVVIHITYEDNIAGQKNSIAYIGRHNEKVKRLEVGSSKFEKFLDTLPKRQTIRLTATNAADILVEILNTKGFKTVCCHWHKTGIEKNLPPEDIAQKFTQLNDSLFRPLVYRRDLAELRKAVSLRRALLQFYGDGVRRIKSIARDQGVPDLQYDLELSSALNDLTRIKNLLPDLKTGETDKRINWNKLVEERAKAVPECILFAKVAHVKSLLSAAAIISVIGDVTRFEGQVSAVWKYLGNHVVNGSSPKRQKGQPSDWSTKGRTALYLLGQSIIKDRSNPWRAEFDKNREYEMAMHDKKNNPSCRRDEEGKCKNKEGHCTAMAIRKVMKEIVKRFVVAASGQKYIKEHHPKPKIRRFPRE